MKIYVAVVEARRKRKDKMKLGLPTKIGGKTSFVSQLFRFVKLSFPVTVRV